MNSTVELLTRVASDLGSVVRADDFAGMTDGAKVDVLREAGAAMRALEAVVVETVASADPDFPDACGCRNMNEVLQRALRTDAQGATKIDRAAYAVERHMSITSGEWMPASYPALREALLDGVIGVSGLLVAIAPFDRIGSRIGLETHLQADAVLAAFARGEHLALDERDDERDDDDDERDDEDDDEREDDGGDDGGEPGPAATPEDLRRFAQELAFALDPDGPEPSDQEGLHHREVTIGRLHKGVHALKGHLLPEVATQLQLIFDAHNNPKVGGAPEPGVAFREEAECVGEGDPFNSDPERKVDDRSPAQKRHDALAAALGIAARHEQTPSLGGAAPTLVVHVDAKDFAAGTGWATTPGGVAGLPLRVAAHTACTGTIQRVLFDEGRIVGISTTDRVFNAHQRRAIVARDQECLIPGCHVPASWCEIHHVTEHSRGGPTHTDNGATLCWYHHRSLDHSEWQIRMDGGVPQIRGPGWWDPTQQWRTPRPSRELLHARTG